MSFEKFKKLLANINSVEERIDRIFDCAKQALECNEKNIDDEEENEDSTNSVSDRQVDVFDTEPDFDLDNL